MNKIIKFKDFEIVQKDNQMKVSTDGILLGAWSQTQDCHRILDIGTGTGVIALIVAQKNQVAKIDAIEIDELAHLEAQHNVDQSDFKGRIDVIKDSIQSYAQTSIVAYDHIICNPPFFSGGTLSTNQSKDAVRHTVKLGHGDLLIAVSKLLKVDGRFSVILPFLEGLRFIEMAGRYNLKVAQKTSVKETENAQISKLLVRFQKTNTMCDYEENEMIINSREGNYSESFLELTKDFHPQ